MTRDEAVQKLATAGRLSIAHAEDLYDSFFPKPIVPQFVADWYEERKDAFEYNLIDAINNIPYGAPDEQFSDFEKWLEDEQSLTTLINMHQFGYEVESEKEYVIKLKNSPQILLYEEKNEEYYFAEHCETFSKESHTRKELEDADFGWVFSCEGVEVKEVE